MSSSEKTYEMLWDCEYCGGKKLLGLTQRFCPTCGGPQNPAKRYFPEEQDKVAVEDHPFVGADVTCPSCRQAMSSACNNCSNCGSPLQGGKQVATHGEQVEGAGGQWQGAAAAPSAQGAAPKKKSWVPAILLVVVLGVVALLVARAVLKKDGEVKVTGHEWTRSVVIERLAVVEETSSCSSAPAGATIKARKTPEPSCTKKRVDNGDGTFKEKNECTQPSEQCTYDVQKWQTHTTLKESGGLDRDPVWPNVVVLPCSRPGCERSGARSENYAVTFSGEGGKTHTCDFSDVAKWKSFEKGSNYAAKIRVVGGDVDCSSLKKK